MKRRSAERAYDSIPNLTICGDLFLSDETRNLLGGILRGFKATYRTRREGKDYYKLYCFIDEPEYMSLLAKIAKLVEHSVLYIYDPEMNMIAKATLHDGFVKILHFDREVGYREAKVLQLDDSANQSASVANY